MRSVSDPSERHPDAQAPNGPGGAAPTRARFALYAWLGLIAALAAAWWWIGSAEPAGPRAQPSEQVTLPGHGSTPRPSKADWAEGLNSSGMRDIAARRSEAARHLMRRSNLNATGGQPDWNRARLHAAIPAKAASDAGPSSR